MARGRSHRAWTVMVLALAVAAVALSVAERQRAAAPPPRRELNYDPPLVSVGTLLEGDQRLERIRVHNTTPRPIQILRVRPSCACTIVKAPLHPIPPGAWAEMEVNFNSQKWQGHVEQTVSILTSGSTEPDLLKVVADVRPAVQILPSVISFGKVDPGKVRTATARLVLPPSGTALRITAIMSSDNCVQPRVRSVGRDAIIDASVRDAPVGELRAYLSVVTDSWRTPEIRIPVTAQVQSKWGLSSRSFFFGLVPRGASPSASVTVFGLRRDMVRGATCTLKEVHAGLRPGPSPNAVTILATMSGKQTERGVTDGAVVLTTLDPAAPRLAIPIDAVLQGPKTGCCN